MIDASRLRNGMEVYSAEGQPLGRIDGVEADAIRVGRRTFRLAALERLEGDRVYLARQAAGNVSRGAGERVVEADEAQVRVPVREERLAVEKRPVELGAVEVRKTVEQEQQTVPVELAREEVRVRKEDVPARPATEGEAAEAFREGTIRVPVRGEEAVARKAAVVTGEVVIDKTKTTETQRVTDTVRRERVEVDEHYDRARAAYQRDLAKRPGAPELEEAEPHFRTGYAAAIDERYAGRAFEEVEPELRRTAGVADESAWERIKREVREGFTRARER